MEAVTRDHDHMNGSTGSDHFVAMFYHLVFTVRVKPMVCRDVAWAYCGTGHAKLKSTDTRSSTPDNLGDQEAKATYDAVLFEPATPLGVDRTHRMGRVADDAVFAQRWWLPFCNRRLLSESGISGTTRRFGVDKLVCDFRGVLGFAFDLDRQIALGLFEQIEKGWGHTFKDNYLSLLCRGQDGYHGKASACSSSNAIFFIHKELTVRLNLFDLLR
jgi:hypothetical protein